MSRANPSASTKPTATKCLRENDLYMRGKLNEPAIRSDTREGSHILNPAEGYRLTGKETAAAMHACSSADSLSASPQMKIETQGGWSNAKPQLVTDKDGLNVKFRPASASSVLPGQPPFHASPQFRYSTVGDTTSITASGKESPRYGKQQAQRHSGRKGTVGATVHPPNYYSLANHFSSKKPDGHRYIAASSPAKVADPTMSVAKNTALLPSNATPGYPKQAATVPVWVQPSPTASMTNLDHFIAATSSEIDQTPSGAASATDASGRSSPMKQVLAMDLGPETEEAIRWLQKNKKHVPEEGITGGHRWPGQQIVQLSPRRRAAALQKGASRVIRMMERLLVRRGMISRVCWYAARGARARHHLRQGALLALMRQLGVRRAHRLRRNGRLLQQRARSSKPKSGSSRSSSRKQPVSIRNRSYRHLFRSKQPADWSSTGGRSFVRIRKKRAEAAAFVWMLPWRRIHTFTAASGPPRTRQKQC